MGKKDKKKAAPPPAEVPIVWKGKPIDLVIHVPPKVAAGQKFDYTCPDGEVVHLTCPRPYPKEGNFRWRWNGPGAPAPRDVKVPHGVKAGDTFVITLKEDGRKIPVTCPTPLPPTGEFTYTPPRRWSTSAATHTATLLKTPLGFGIHLTADNVITAIDEGSQAARDGHFKVGDQVCSLNETPLSPEVTLSSVLAEFSNGEHVVFGLKAPTALNSLVRALSGKNIALTEKGPDGSPVPMGVPASQVPMGVPDAAPKPAALLPQMNIVATPGGAATVNELNAWLQAYNEAYASLDAPRWLAALAPGLVTSHSGDGRGGESPPEVVFNGGFCAALASCKPPAAKLAQATLGALTARGFVKSTAELKAAGRIDGFVTLHVKTVQYNAAGPMATLGHIYRLQPTGASFVVAEMWTLPDAEITSLPSQIRESGMLKPVRLPRK